MTVRRLATIALALGVGLAQASRSWADPAAQAAAAAAAPPPVYPLKVGPDRRHLVDQAGKPFMMLGDSPHSMIAMMSLTEAELYLANRQRHGINTLWVELLCNSATACRPDGSTFDGIPPLLAPGDLLTPNAAYFDRAEAILTLAAAHGMTVLLDVAETDGWLETFRANGKRRCFRFGRYLGQRFRSVPNIIWMYGNDFQSWTDPRDDRLIRALAKGIRSVDRVHLNTTELNWFSSASLDDPSWAPLIQLDGVFTYFPTYAKLLAEYNRKNFRPVFLEEASYEFEHIKGTSPGSPGNLRRQEYWTMLSGATGQVYGDRDTWRLLPGWQTRLDSPGIIQLDHMRALFLARRWYELVPDQTHAVLTAGFGVAAPPGTGSVATDTYATAAATPDGSLMIAYLPTPRRVTIDMARFSGRVTARWYDPTNGTYAAIGGSPFANAGNQEFLPPGRNQDGDGDWVLVLETRPPA